MKVFTSGLRSRLLGMALLPALLLCGCGDSGKNKLRVALGETYPPFVFIDKGEIAGSDIAIIRRIAEELNMEVEPENICFKRLLHHVSEGHSQIGAGGITINAERQRFLAFSDPYFTERVLLLTRTDADYRTVKDLDGKTVGAESGTTMAGLAKSRLPGTRSREFVDVPGAIQALLERKIDAVIINESYISDDNQLRQALREIPCDLSREDYGLAMPPEFAKAYGKKINTILKQLKASGELREIIEKNREIYRNLQNKTPAAKTFTVLTDPILPPFTGYTAKNGTGDLTGLDIDIARRLAVALHLNLKIEIVPTDRMTETLASGVGDAAISALTRTPERAALLRLSLPYFSTGKAAVVRRDSGIKSAADLTGKEWIIGALYGSININEIAVATGRTPEQYGDINLGIQEVKRGKIHAFIEAEALLSKQAYQDNELMVLPLPWAKEDYIIAFPPGNNELTAKICTQLEKMIQSGELKEIIREHLEQK